MKKLTRAETLDELLRLLDILLFSKTTTEEQQFILKQIKIERTVYAQYEIDKALNRSDKAREREAAKLGLRSVTNE